MMNNDATNMKEKNEKKLRQRQRQRRIDHLILLFFLSFINIYLTKHKFVISSVFRAHLFFVFSLLRFVYLGRGRMYNEIILVITLSLSLSLVFSPCCSVDRRGRETVFFQKSEV